MDKEVRLREHAAHYMPCFTDSCPHHASCLHWLTGQHTTADSVSIVCVNPVNPDVKAGRCTLYRENTVVQHARGMMHFFDEMPSKKERNIKQRLIHLYGRKRFYEYRNGVRLISPTLQQQIASICQEEGWTAAPVYDSWVEDFLW